MEAVEECMFETKILDTYKVFDVPQVHRTRHIYTDRNRLTSGMEIAKQSQKFSLVRASRRFALQSTFARACFKVLSTRSNTQIRLSSKTPARAFRLSIEAPCAYSPTPTPKHLAPRRSNLTRSISPTMLTPPPRQYALVLELLVGYPFLVWCPSLIWSMEG